MKGFPDKPLEQGEKDLFDVSVYIDSLAEFIQDCDTPMTIAIQGDWGSGKTSMMKLIDSNLDSKVCSIWFNTWQYSQFNFGDQLAISLMNKMLISLGDKSPEVKKIVDGVLGFTKKIISASVKQVSGGIVDMDSAVNGYKEYDYIEEIINLKSKFQEVIDAKIKKESIDRIVIFVDDLDRLQPEKAVEMLEVMKVFLDCKSCVFVLAVDYAVVSQGIKNKFGDSVSDEKGKSFFDKIIQLPFKMPVGLYNLDKFIYDTLKKLQIRADEEDIEQYKALIMSSITQNPRSMKRLFNSFELIKSIVKKNNKAETLEPNAQRILLGVLCMQMAFEKMYEFLIQNRDELSNDFFSIESKEDLAFRIYENEMKPEDSYLARMYNFYRSFTNAIQLDNDSSISEDEIKYLRDLLVYSAITSSVSNITSGDAKNDQRRYKCRNITKELIKILNDSTGSEFKLYQGNASITAAAYIPFRLEHIDFNFQLEIQPDFDEIVVDVNLICLQKSNFTKFEGLCTSLFGNNIKLERFDSQLYAVLVNKEEIGLFNDYKTTDHDLAKKCYEFVKEIVNESLQKLRMRSE